MGYRMTEEDLRMQEDNLKHRDDICYEGVRNLQHGICQQAIDDYKRALLGKKVDRMSPGNVMRECEAFFETDMFKASTGINDTECAIERIKRTLIEDIQYGDNERLKRIREKQEKHKKLTELETEFLAKWNNEISRGDYYEKLYMSLGKKKNTNVRW